MTQEQERFGNVKINGLWYRIQDGSWRQKDVTDFSPRASTPGGGIVYSEMDLYQVITQTDWRHGFGFQWYEDAAGYSDTTGQLNCTTPGIVTLGTATTKSTTNNLATPTSPVISRPFVTMSHNNYPVTMMLNGGVVTAYYFVGEWSVMTVWPSAPTKAFGFFQNGTYTFALSSNRLRKSTDLANWTDAGINANCTNYAWMVAHDGFVFAGKYNTNEVYFGGAADLSDLHGLASEDPNVIKVGPAGNYVKGAVSYAGSLYFSRSDGLYKMDADRSAARKVLDYQDQYSANNFNSMAVFNGQIIFSVNDQVFSWNGARVSPITPPYLTDTFPYLYYKTFGNFITVGNLLYCSAKISDASGDALLIYDGVGWTKAFRTDNTVSINNISLLTATTHNGNMLVIDMPGASPMNGVFTMPINSSRDVTTPPYPTGTPNSLITSRIDAGFRRVQKSTPSILVEASSVDTTRYLKVYYRLDTNTAWLPWGGVDGTTNTIKTNGVIELTKPTTTAPTIEYYWIQFRIDLVTTNSSYTPALEGLSLRLILRPKTSYGASFIVIGENEVPFGTAGSTETRDSYGILSDIKVARESASPVQFTDIWGDSYLVYVTSVSDVIGETDSDDTGPHPDHKHLLQVNIVEAK